MSSGRYRIVVRGLLDDRFATAFDDMTQARAGRDTVLEGPFLDRPQFDGIFDRLRRLGLEIRSFTTETGGQQ